MFFECVAPWFFFLILYWRNVCVAGCKHEIKRFFLFSGDLRTMRNVCWTFSHTVLFTGIRKEYLINCSTILPFFFFFFILSVRRDPGSYMYKVITIPELKKYIQYNPNKQTNKDYFTRSFIGRFHTSLTTKSLCRANSGASWIKDVCVLFVFIKEGCVLFVSVTFSALIFTLNKY